MIKPPQYRPHNITDRDLICDSGHTPEGGISISHVLEVTPLLRAGFRKGFRGAKFHASRAAVYAILDVYDPFITFFDLKLLLIRSAGKVRALRQNRGECEV